QVQVAQAKAPAAVACRQSNQPVRDLGVLIREFRLIAVAGLADVERLTGQPDGRAPCGHRLLRHLAAARWLHHFFASASWTISALIRSSAYIFFSRRFSSSSSFSLAIIEASMPPNFARHLSNVAALMPCSRHNCG